jgi:hypothetical protein
MTARILEEVTKNKRFDIHSVIITCLTKHLFLTKDDISDKQFENLKKFILLALIPNDFAVDEGLRSGLSVVANSTICRTPYQNQSSLFDKWFLFNDPQISKNENAKMVGYRNGPIGRSRIDGGVCSLQQPRPSPRLSA